VVSNFSTRGMPHALTENVDLLPYSMCYQLYGDETLGNKFYLRRKPLHSLLVFRRGPFWYTQQLYFHHTLRLYISHGTDSIMTRYGSGRTEIPFGPFDVGMRASPFLIQNSPIEDTPLQC
jgi:hypothetical protein